MAEFIPDNIDWRQYETQTDASIKVRPASAFADALALMFAPKTATDATMTSTKLRKFLEFRRAELSAYTGFSGHRKSMFTGQIALDLCAQSQRVLIVSPEMEPARTLARMARQFLAVDTPNAQLLKSFNDWTVGRLWLFNHVGRIDSKTCVAVCRYFAVELKGAHVFIDSMMMVCSSEEHLDEQKQLVTDFVGLAQETGVHIHLVTHCRKPPSGDDSKPPTKYDVRGSTAITDQAHNVLCVWANKPKFKRLAINANDVDALQEPDAAVLIDKQRNGDFEGRIALWFDPRTLRFMDDRTSPVTPYLTHPLE